MYERKPWTQNVPIILKKQDQTLRELKEVRRIGKWSQIAIIMKEQFQIYGRNGKQCRQRYHNHLDSRISKEQWSIQQEAKLLSLHNQWGNRWAAISRQLPGRTDNCVKNHFYSCFRKGIKNVNILISNNPKKKIKPLKLVLINKIIGVIQAYHKDPENYNQSVYEQAKCKILQILEIKSFIVNIKNEGNQQENLKGVEYLDKKIAEFCFASRKKMGRKRKIKIESQDSSQIKQEAISPHQNFFVEKKLFVNPEGDGRFDNYFSHKKVGIMNEQVQKKEQECATFPILQQTPIKITDKDDKHKNSSYSHINSVDCLEGKSFGNFNIRDLNYMDEEKQWKLYFD